MIKKIKTEIRTKMKVKKMKLFHQKINKDLK